MASLEERLTRYIAGQLPAATELRVEGLDRIFGGASRETYRFVLHWREDGQERRRPLILRRDPPGSLIETERAIEFGAYRAFHGTTVPVPEPLWLEEDKEWLDYPFFVMEELQGLESSPQAIALPPYTEHHESYARRMWTILGEIASADPAELGLVDVMEPVSAEAARWRELDYWEARIDRDELCPQPIVRAAIRWCRRNPPPPAQRVSVVHGDYRTGNYLYDAEGRIHAILDWEMAHLGDPLEDLAWSINPVWGPGGKTGGLTTRDEALRIWEKASGLTADPAGLHWWEVFTSIKGQAIWVSSAKEFSDGVNQDLILALASWLMGNSQDRAALFELGYLS